MKFQVPLSVLLTLATADDPSPADPKGEAARSTAAVELARVEAKLYRIELEESSKSAAKFQPDALLQWSNPVAGSIHGSVFVWTDRGCPVVVASIYKWFAPNTHLGAELHSLTPTIASAERKGRPVWFPGKADVERKPITGAPMPADSPSGRLRQLRVLAKEFTASETTREDLNRELRLLTQPLYRYESSDPEVIDGALFGFVHATDPEIILVNEARKGAAGLEWQYAAARMNSLTLRLSHKGVEAWSAPVISWAAARDHRKPYTLFLYGSDPGMTFDDPGE
jgi:hypothetical protein